MRGAGGLPGLFGNGYFGKGALPAGRGNFVAAWGQAGKVTIKASLSEWEKRGSW